MVWYEQQLQQYENQILNALQTGFRQRTIQITASVAEGKQKTEKNQQNVACKTIHFYVENIVFKMEKIQSKLQWNINWVNMKLF